MQRAFKIFCDGKFRDFQIRKVKQKEALSTIGKFKLNALFIHPPWYSLLWPGHMKILSSNIFQFLKDAKIVRQIFFNFSKTQKKSFVKYFSISPWRKTFCQLFFNFSKTKNSFVKYFSISPWRKDRQIFFNFSNTQKSFVKYFSISPSWRKVFRQILSNFSKTQKVFCQIFFIFSKTQKSFVKYFSISPRRKIFCQIFFNFSKTKNLLSNTFQFLHDKKSFVEYFSGKTFSTDIVLEKSDSL